MATTKKRVGQPPRERGDERGVGRSGQAAGDQVPARRGQRVEHPVERRKTFDRVEQRVERHQPVTLRERPRAPMAIASMSSIRSATISAGSISERRAAALNAIAATPPRRAAASVRSERRRSRSSSAVQAIEHRFLRRRIDDERLRRAVGPCEKIGAGARRHVEEIAVAERSALSVGALDRVGPSRTRQARARLSGDRLPRLADETFGEHAAQPRHERRAHRQVRRVGRERRSDEHVPRAGDDPRVAARRRQACRRRRRPAATRS